LPNDRRLVNPLGTNTYAAWSFLVDLEVSWAYSASILGTTGVGPGTA
jgi:hypothetical protein